MINDTRSHLLSVLSTRLQACTFAFSFNPHHILLTPILQERTSRLGNYLRLPSCDWRQRGKKAGRVGEGWLLKGGET